MTQPYGWWAPAVSAADVADYVDAVGHLAKTRRIDPLRVAMTGLNAELAHPQQMLRP